METTGENSAAHGAFNNQGGSTSSVTSVQRLKWSLLRQKNKNRSLAAKSAKLWRQKRKQEEEINALKKSLNKQKKITKEVREELQISRDRCANYWAKLVEEKQQKAADKTMFNKIDHYMSSTCITLSNGFERQSDLLQDYIIREARMESHLNETEEEFEEEVLKLEEMIQSKDSEIANLRSQVVDMTQCKEEWRKRCVALEGNIQIKSPENNKRKRKNKAKSSDDDSMRRPSQSQKELASDAQEHREEGPSKKRKKKVRVHDDEVSGPSQATPRRPFWPSTPYSHVHIPFTPCSCPPSPFDSSSPSPPFSIYRGSAEASQMIQSPKRKQ